MICHLLNIQYNTIFHAALPSARHFSICDCRRTKKCAAAIRKSNTSAILYCNSISTAPPGQTLGESDTVKPGRLNALSLLTCVYTPSHRLFTQQSIWCGVWALDHQSLSTSKPLHFRYIRSMRSAARKGPITVWSLSSHTNTYTIHQIWQRPLPSRDSYRYRSNHNKKHMNFSPN